MGKLDDVVESLVSSAALGDGGGVGRVWNMDWDIDCRWRRKSRWKLRRVVLSAGRRETESTSMGWREGEGVDEAWVRKDVDPEEWCAPCLSRRIWQDSSFWSRRAHSMCVRVQRTVITEATERHGDGRARITAGLKWPTSRTLRSYN